MPSRPFRFTSLLLPGAGILLFGLMVTLAVLMNQTNLESLSFHTKDFPYYLQFGLKWLDPHYTPRMSINPNGINFLGFYGPEATTSIHQAIHFEPIKYVDALVLGLSRRVSLLFGWRALLTFLPLLYLSLIIPTRPRAERGWWLVVFVILVTLPPTLANVAYDLRPFQIIAPFLCCGIFAIGLRRPRWEHLLWLNALFLIREEALLVGAGLVAYAWWQERDDAEIPKGAKGMALCWVLWASVIFLYYGWSGFPNRYLIPVAENTSFYPVNLIALIPVAMAVVLLLFVLLQQRKGLLAPLLVPTLLLFPVAWQLWTSFKDDETHDILNALLFSPQPYLFYLIFVSILIVMGVEFGQPLRRWLMVVLAGIAIASLVVTLSHEESPFREWQEAQEDIVDTSAVRALRSQTNPYETTILTDESTYQAFYDYENVLLYDYLPWYLAQGEARFYPQNAATLHAVCASNVAYIVVEESSEEAIRRDCIVPSGRAWAEIVRNDEFVIYHSTP
jgi:hypothetical protein